MSPYSYAKFQSRKKTYLSKRDKSSSGQIDKEAILVCSLLNDRIEYYTLSSCSGRYFLYNGEFGKGNRSGYQRFCVNHDLVDDAKKYFKFETLRDRKEKNSKIIWLKYEPFILHVMCSSIQAAYILVTAARPIFKNVGLTNWKNERYVIIIWGDEGLDMPLFCDTNNDDNHTFVFEGNEDWLASLVNNRQEKNWKKINRFVENIKLIPKTTSLTINNLLPSWDQNCTLSNYEPPFVRDLSSEILPVKLYNVIGDVAIIGTSILPPSSVSCDKSIPLSLQSWYSKIGTSVLRGNKAIRIVACHHESLCGTERSLSGCDDTDTANTLQIIAGPCRNPLITSHSEYGIKAVIDLNRTFFSPRMCQERNRICQQVSSGEHVLVLFCGVGMQALQILGRTTVNKVTAIDQNTVAVTCARRGLELLSRNKILSSRPAIPERLTILKGDALKLMSTFNQQSFDRIISPRPKEGLSDCDIGIGRGGIEFLIGLSPLLKIDGTCHWYDFVADWEYPSCERIKKRIQKACEICNVSLEVVGVVKIGSVAKRQWRVCLDIKRRKPSKCNESITK